MSKQPNRATGELLEERREENGRHIWIAKDPDTNVIVARFSSEDRSELDTMVEMWKAAEVTRTKQAKVDQ